jgi:hypothetical protein
MLPLGGVQETHRRRIRIAVQVGQIYAGPIHPVISVSSGQSQMFLSLLWWLEAKDC